MSTGLIILILAMLLWASGDRMAFSAVLVGAVFIGFWWMIARILIGFGRWVTAPTPFRPVRHFGQAPRCSRRSLGASKVCTDRLCGRVNLDGARFCAQCGRRLHSKF